MEFCTTLDRCSSSGYLESIIPKNARIPDGALYGFLICRLYDSHSSTDFLLSLVHPFKYSDTIALISEDESTLCRGGFFACSRCAADSIEPSFANSVLFLSSSGLDGSSGASEHTPFFSFSTFSTFLGVSVCCTVWCPSVVLLAVLYAVLSDWYASQLTIDITVITLDFRCTIWCTVFSDNSDMNLRTFPRDHFQRCARKSSPPSNSPHDKWMSIPRIRTSLGLWFAIKRRSFHACHLVNGSLKYIGLSTDDLQSLMYPLCMIYPFLVLCR